MATRRHFDLRLEVDGVMRSWALPQVPSIAAGERREAIEVADHTYLDARFEGRTPNGGVIIWDRGTYERSGLVPWPAALDRGWRSSGWTAKSCGAISPFSATPGEASDPAVG
jgi:bifunctional non-homologous end joining protein LigD